MKKLLLNKGKYTIVDNENYNSVNKFTWFISDTGYAIRTVWKNGKTTKVRMHRFLMGAKKGEFVDHINMDKLDNRMSNLRLCNNAQNMRNSSLRSNNTTGFKGIRQNWNKWLARIKVNYQEKYLGSFNSKEEAALAYNKAAVKYFGEFANLNKVGVAFMLFVVFSIPLLSKAQLTANQGGTGNTTYTAGDMIYALTTNPLRFTKLNIGAAGTCLTSNGSVPGWSTCSAGGFAFPFDVFPNYSSTSTTLGLFGGLFSTASSSFSGPFRFPSLSQGSLYVGSTGLVNTTATTTASCAGTVSCSTFTIFGASPVTLTGSGSGSSNPGTVSTSTIPTIGQVAYWTTSGAYPELLGSVATGTVSAGTGISVTAGRYVIGGGLTITNDGVTSISGTAPIVNSASVGPVALSCPTCIVTGTRDWFVNGLFLTPTTTIKTFINQSTSTIFSANFGEFGATATSTLTLDGKIGVGTTSPAARLAVNSVAGDNFSLWVGSTSAPWLRVSNSGFGTTTLSGLNIIGSATSTSNVGWNITTGCYAIGGTCLTQNSGTVTSVALSDTNSTLTVGGSPITTSGTLTATLNLAHTNTWSVLQNFNYSSSTIYSSFLNASSTFYFGAGLTTCNSASSALTWAAGVFGCNTITGGSGSDPFVHFNGVNSATTTSMAIGTTTANNYQLTVASTTVPQLSLSNGVGILQWIFRNAGGNLYFATTTVDGTATTSTSALSINGITGGISLATSTTGCLQTSSLGLIYAGSCAAGGAVTGSGAANRVAFWTTSSNISFNNNFVWNDSLSRLGISTTTPFAQLSVESQAGVAAFTVGSSTATSLIVASNGNVGVATSSPFKPFSTVGDSWHTGGFFHFGNSVSQSPCNSFGAQCLEVVGNDNTDGGTLVTIENRTAGAQAYSGLTLLNDRISANTTNYAGLFLNSSQYNSNTFGYANNFPDILALQNTVGNVAIMASSTVPTATATTSIPHYINGTFPSNEVGRWTASTTILTPSAVLAGFLPESMGHLLVGTSTQFGMLNGLDQLFVNGRLNYSDLQSFCDNPLGSQPAQVTADSIFGCDGWFFAEDTIGTLTQGSGSGYTFGRLDTINTNDGAGVFMNGDATNGWLTLGTSTPVMEVNARLVTVQGSQAAQQRHYIGFSNLAVSGTAWETAPSAGCYFTASSTTANWMAMCSTNGTTAQTIVNTGVASSTVLVGTGGFYTFRIEASQTEVRFYIKSSQAGTLSKVATITTNIPTVTLNGGVWIARINGVGAMSMDFFRLRAWWRNQLPAL